MLRVQPCALVCVAVCLWVSVRARASNNVVTALCCSVITAGDIHWKFTLLVNGSFAKLRGRIWYQRVTGDELDEDALEGLWEATPAGADCGAEPEICSRDAQVPAPATTAGAVASTAEPTTEQQELVEAGRQGVNEVL